MTLRYEGENEEEPRDIGIWKIDYTTFTEVFGSYSTKLMKPSSSDLNSYKSEVMS